MKYMSVFMAMVLAAVIAGCASVDVVNEKNLNNLQVCTSGKSVAHLQANNWGLYLFSIPLITGSTDVPGKTVFLEDTVTVENVVKMTTAKSKQIGASKTYNMVSIHSTNPWFFGFKEVSLSANALK